MINYYPFNVRRQKFGVIGVHVDPPKIKFFGRLYFGPYGMLPLKFLYVLENGQDLLTHTIRGQGSAKIFLQLFTIAIQKFANESEAHIDKRKAALSNTISVTFDEKKTIG